MGVGKGVWRRERERVVRVVIKSVDVVVDVDEGVEVEVMDAGRRDWRVERGRTADD
jgi:hypothetical protein